MSISQHPPSYIPIAISLSIMIALLWSQPFLLYYKFQGFFFSNLRKETYLIFYSISLYLKYLLGYLKRLANIGKCFLNSDKFETQKIRIYQIWQIISSKIMICKNLRICLI